MDDVRRLAAAMLAGDPAAMRRALADAAQRRNGALEVAEEVAGPALRHLDAALGCRPSSRPRVALAAAEVETWLAGATPPPRHGGPVALVGTPSKEEHRVAALVLVAALRDAGWDARGPRGWDEEGLVAAVREEGPEAVYLSATAPAQLLEARDLAQALRRTSWRGALVVGGVLFRRDPSLHRELGADGTAHDARAAARQSRSLWARP
jgi:MerR family transcriptional regulator, light-induced transcriptional regulator